MGVASNGPLMVQIPVPSFFLCPISLELMTDPVTLSSGQTYDRKSIQKWLDDGNCSCPVTRIPINTEQEDPIPNHALRRMIQAWCVQNKSSGIERIHTPRQPPSLKDIPLLLDQIRIQHAAHDNGRHLCADALQKLCILALDRPKARLLLLRAGAPHIISLCLSKSLLVCRKTLPSVEVKDALHLLASLAEEAEACPRTSFSWEPACIDDVSALAEMIADERTKIELRRDAAVVLSKAADQLFDCMKREVGAIQGFMSRVVGLIREASAASMASLQYSCTSSSLDCGLAGLGLMLAVCKPCTKNRHLAFEVGALDALACLLGSLCPAAHLCPNAAHMRLAELGLKVWESLCKCAEGRAATWQSMGLLMQLMCNVSERATKYSIHILWLLLKFAPVGAPVAKIAFEQGAFLKAMAVAQGDASLRTRSLAGKIAKALSRFVIASHSHLYLE
ncbi:hypothetical protein GOP47_0004535 [Adiantum capillus-veneris]|uniref:RING-type E3 ubiquitin transferase n=1 Tax=Adiantum capillus-veneris TaxID=13818 RepID=A0A9D4ZPN6_ADICA|nr:hypothetical protein GOP47_0004535 [Adiantum capillus-veneris]